MSGSIISIVREVEIRLNSESIFRIFVIAPVGLGVYESKMWPTMLGFEPKKAIQRICGLPDAHEMGKSLAHSLTVISRVLHHMLCSIFLPHDGNRDEVSYYEAFLIDSILTRRRIHLGHLMMMYMIACCQSTTRVIPYDHFLTRVFKDVDVDLSREMNFEALNTYDKYDDQSMGMMKFDKGLNGSWVRKVEKAPTQAWGQGQAHPGVENEAEIQEIEDEVDP